MPEVGHTRTQHGGVERDVDPRNQNERALAARLGTEFFDLLLEHLESSDRACDRVLRAEQVEVHDLQELTGAFADLRDPVHDIGVGQSELTRPDRGHAVIAAALRISWDQMVHGLAALEHDLEDSLQRQHPGARGERVVLAHRVTTGDGVLDETARLLEFGDLRDAQSGHGHLCELRQEQHPVRVVVGGAACRECGRVVADHGQDRKAESIPGVLVRPVPDLAGSLGPRPCVESHALALDALPGERVDGLGRREKAGGVHHEQVADFRADLDDVAAGVHTDAVDADGDLVTGANHTQETRGPAEQCARHRDGVLGVGGGHDVLCSRGQPHAVSDRAAETGHLRCRHVGVNGVVIT